MVAQRFLSALVWLALASGAVILLYPSLVPQVHVPAAVEAILHDHKVLLGRIMGLAAALFALIVVSDMVRPRPRRRY